MKKLLQFFILSLLIVSPHLILAQDKKPKIALVLSGGGAKGIAHIPTLQILDSLGIVPDLIIGTSMGSVVGGFYAMGYSGDSIATITKNAKWDELLGGVTSLNDVGVEEKSEYKKYMVDFDWVKGKPKISSALLSDQNLREFFSTYAYPVYRINDFDDLPIPFRAMTTDIVNGKEVVLKNGSISFAMRASMSIPTIFRAMPYNGTLLVDGGVLNNFPVDVAKEMGFDFIIGSDVGGGMEPKEKLESIPAILFQTGMLTSLIKNPANQELCDILIDHVPSLTYSTGDFTKSTEIYEQGKIATYKNMEAFVALAEKIKNYNQRPHILPIAPKEIFIDSFTYKNISKGNIDLVQSRTNLIPHKKYTINEIKKGVNRAMGTELFSQITFNPTFESGSDKVNLEIEGFEKSKHQIKGSLHYDTYRGIGLFVNYTGRNIIGDASRFLISIDIAEQPGFRVQYQKNIGEKKDWWWRSEALGQKLIQNFYVLGENVDDLDYRYFQFDNQFNKNIHPLKSYVGIGLNYENTTLKPTVDPEVADNPFFLENYNFKNFEIYAHYFYNTMDLTFFPTKGAFFNAKLSRSIYHDMDIHFTDENIPRVNGATNSFTKLGLDFEKRLHLHKNITGIFGVSTNFIFVDDLKSDDVSFIEYGYGGSYSLGGNLIRPRKGDFIFPGLNEGELVVTQFMMLNLGLQIKTFNKLFLTPHMNIASVGFGNFDDYIEDAFNPKGDWQFSQTSKLISGGITASYNSFLGPVTFDVSWVNNINKVRTFFGVGIQFNRSN